MLFAFPLQPEIGSVNKATVMTRNRPKGILRRTENAAGNRRSGAHSTVKKVVGAVSRDAVPSVEFPVVESINETVPVGTAAEWALLNSYTDATSV